MQRFNIADANGAQTNATVRPPEGGPYERDEWRT